MKITKGNCKGCGKEGIITIRTKGKEELTKAKKILKGKNTMINYGAGNYCCSWWCYLKARKYRGQTDFRG